MISAATIGLNAVFAHLSRRGFMPGMPCLASLGGTGLLAACQGTREPAATPAPGGNGGQAVREVGPAARPMYQMDPQHTGRSPHAGPRRATLVRTFDTTSVETREPGDPRPEIQSSAAIAPDGTIYIGNFPGILCALRDPGKGDSLELLWRFHPAGASSFH